MKKLIAIAILGTLLAGCQTDGTTTALDPADPQVTYAFRGSHGTSIECMARNVYREAAHEGKKGWLAVYAVTMNRVRSQAFPNSVCDVVFQKVQVTRKGRTKTVYQFSWNHFAHMRPIPKTEKYNQVKQQVTVWMMSGYSDPTGGATHYHATYVNPRWRLNRTTRIGQHIFYRARNRPTPVDPPRG